MIELFAIVVEGPALPDRGCRGVGPPVALVERGGRRVVLLLRSVGSCGSGWIAPSFWRSRILKSRRLIWRSSWRGSISKPRFFPLAGKGGRRGTYQQSSLVTQAHLFLLDNLRFVEVGHDVFAIAFFLGVWLTGSIKLEELLDAAVAGCNYVSALLNDSIFGLDFFEKMRDFGRQICHFLGLSVLSKQRMSSLHIFTILDELL